MNVGSGADLSDSERRPFDFEKKISPWGYFGLMQERGEKFDSEYTTSSPWIVRGTWLLLEIDRKSYMGNPTAPLDLTWADLERSN